MIPFMSWGTAAKPAEKLWKDRNYKKAEQELKVKQADGKITNKQFYKETKAMKKETDGETEKAGSPAEENPVYDQ